jgi:hypothetical protein
MTPKRFLARANAVRQVTMDRGVRLATCDLTPRRFAGRADLRRQAATNDVALAQLEYRLGLAPITAWRRAQYDEATRWLSERLDPLAQRLAQLGPRERRVAALAAWARAMAGDGSHLAIDIARLAAPEAIVDANATMNRRATARAANPDALAERRPGHALREHAERVARRAIKAAGFRVVTNGHKTLVEVVEPGEEGVCASADQVSSSAAGMPRTYCQVAYAITQSVHAWRVSTAILALGVLQGSGVVYLRDDLRVVQGRGTGLRVERRQGPQGGWR